MRNLMLSYREVLEKQRQFFDSGATRSLSFRIEQLKKLKILVETSENEIIAALNKDLARPQIEAFGEIVFVIQEINLAIQNLQKWSRSVKVKTPYLSLWPGRSQIYFEPYGVVLIIGTWNY